MAGSRFFTRRDLLTSRVCKWRLCSRYISFVVLIVLCGTDSASAQSASHHEGGTRCYDDLGRPQRCIPEFENAAFNVDVEVTNTCGESGTTEFCIQTGASGNKKSCDFCIAEDPYRSHPPSYLTDFNNNENQTWWQSETMYEGIEYPNQVNLSLHLRKAFDITYVRLWFYSPRPESFAIYKRTTEDGPWTPYQFYSATCRDTYQLPDSNFARFGEETRALCTSEYSDISPLTGGNVAFSTLEGRPSAYSFDTSPELQEWVTATDIRITLDRLNTFGDEVFGDAKVLRSYFYAISDFAVGARCKCNGHASECVSSTGVDGGVRRVCRCQHNTAGPDCNECLPFYNDAPWGRATQNNAHECIACNCNGFSTRCFFDQELYDRTSHGGHCLDCTGNRDGPNCERCKENFYQREDGYCIACNCNELGSRSLQCNSEGKCQCKTGVTGEKCDRCETNHYDFSAQGCKPCGCSVPGSYANEPECDPYTGTCQCKENVEGKRCDRCKPGFFNIDMTNEFGCTPCFCYGHSSVCRSAPGYSRVFIDSIFARGSERWTAQDHTGRSISLQYSSVTQTVGVNALGRESVYFISPDRFLGDQRASYNQDLTFKLRIGESGPRATVEDLILEGAGLSITQTIFGQGNPLPTIQTQEYKFRLHEHPDYGWNPRLTARDFISILANLTSIKIRGTYSPEGVGFLDDVRLETARRGAAGQPANWIEMCTCPDGYVGQYCESCAPGFRHEPANGGPFARCVPCNCNGHADICDAETGRCICQHNTGGDNCERCARGYYGNALQGTSNDCSPCPCPSQGPCIQLVDETVVCLECPTGYSGPRCDLCSDGYYGDPTGRFGPTRLCQLCDCNGNVDPNAVGNCNRTTGECLKCIYNTGGPHCDQCLPGFYGDALSLDKGDCKPCQCYYQGTQQTGFGPPLCDQLTGQCHCKAHVVETNCNQCEDGYYNIDSGEGCEPCNCDSIGSVNHTCDIQTGQCICRPGVMGQRCDVCEPYHYGFSSDGCKPCECDQIGSVALQCDPFGQCPCRENVEGRRCDRCKENKYNRQLGCVDCPPCYNLVQDAANDHRNKLADLERVLEDIANTPTVIDDLDFERKLAAVQEYVDNLWADARQGTGGDDKSLLQRLDQLGKRLNAVNDMLNQGNEWIDKAHGTTSEGERNVTLAEEVIKRANEQLKNALDYIQTEGKDALQKAVERSEEFGQQSDRMSEIAREARHLAEQQEQEAKGIAQIAERAYNTSTQAYEQARDSINQQRNISDELRVLKNNIETSSDQLDRVRALAEDARGRADKAKQDAVGIYTEMLALTVPPANISQLKEEADQISDEASRIKAEADELVQTNREILTELEQQIELARDLLEKGISQQQETDEQLADMDVTLERAKQAVGLGDKTLQEAQNTYETLAEFDQQVQDSKGKAEEALEKADEIDQLIRQAEEKTVDAENALADAEKDALNARKQAQEAQQIYAAQASQDAVGIREGADETKQEAERLRDQSDKLAKEVAETENKLDELESQAERDSNNAKLALQRSNEATRKADEAATQVQDALGIVQEILDELSNFHDVDESLLNDLEDRLKDAKHVLNLSELQKNVNEIKDAKLQQAQLLKLYGNELEKLQEEVNKIENIHDALPPDCFKRVKLEP